MRSWYEAQCRARSLLVTVGARGGSGDISVSGLTWSAAAGGTGGTGGDWRDLIFSEKKPSVSLFALVWVIVVTAVTATISSHFYAKYESWIIINYFHWCSKSSVIYVNAHIHLQLYENGTLTTPAGQSYRSEAKWINIWPSLSCFIRSEGVREWGRDLMLTRSQLLYPQSSKNQWQLLKEVQRWYRTKFNQKMWFLR